MLIDFGWGTESRYYPYINIDIKNYLEYSDFFKLLNDVYQMSIINKKYFKQFKLWKQKY